MTKKKAVKKSQNRISGAAFTAPILVLFVMILLLAGEFYVKRATSSGENVLLSICIVQGIAFLAPTLLYYQLKHRKLSTSIFVSPVKISHGVFIIFASLLFFSGQILLKYFLYKFFGVESVSSTNISIEGVPAIQPILAFCLVPAICEEFFFRGVILSEYRSFGIIKAIIISSFFFAFCHFSFSGFLIYIFAGFMLSFLTVVCRSVFPAMILHFANNLIDLYAGNFFNNFASNDSDAYFFKFLLVLTFLISLWRVFSRMQHIYIRYAEKPPKEDITKSTVNGGVFRSWTLLFPIGAFLLITAISG
jgi:membrane protease YdiL (CAAX protease family)